MRADLNRERCPFCLRDMTVLTSGRFCRHNETRPVQARDGSHVWKVKPGRPCSGSKMTPASAREWYERDPGQEWMLTCPACARRVRKQKNGLVPMHRADGVMCPAVGRAPEVAYLDAITRAIPDGPVDAPKISPDFRTFKVNILNSGALDALTLRYMPSHAAITEVTLDVTNHTLSALWEEF
jgi:hypothetical protein